MKRDTSPEGERFSDLTLTLRGQELTSELGLHFNAISVEVFSETLKVFDGTKERNMAPMTFYAPAQDANVLSLAKASRAEIHWFDTRASARR